MTGVYIATNCDEFAACTISSKEYLLHLYATIVKNVQLKNNWPFLAVGTWDHCLYRSNSLTGQVDVLAVET